MKLILTILFTFTLSINLSAQWFWPNPLPQGNNLEDVYFTDQNHGWAVWWSGTILKATNGGEDWSLQYCNTSSNLLGVYFIDRFNGTVVGSDGIILLLK